MVSCAFGAVDEGILNSLRAPIDVCLGMQSICPGSTLLRDSSFRKGRGDLSCVTLYPLTDVKVGGKRYATIFPSKGDRIATLAKAFGITRTVGTFLGHFSVRKPSEGIYKLFKCATFSTIHCFRGVPIVRTRRRRGSTPSVLCVLCGCMLIFGRFGGRLALIRLVRSNRGSNLRRVRALVRGQGCTSCGFRTANPRASPIDKRRCGTVIHRNVHRYLHKSIFRVILDHQFRRPFGKSSFGICQTLQDVGPSPCLFCFSFKKFHVFNSSPRARYGMTSKRTDVSPVTNATFHAKSITLSERHARTLLTSPGRGTRRIVLISLTHGSLSHGTRSMRISFCGRIRCCDRIVRLMSHIDNRVSTSDGPVGACVSAFPTKALDKTPGMHTVRLVASVRGRGQNTCNNYVKFVNFSNSLGRTVAVHAFIDHKGILCCRTKTNVITGDGSRQRLRRIGGGLNTLGGTVSLTAALVG